MLQYFVGFRRAWFLYYTHSQYLTWMTKKECQVRCLGKLFDLDGKNENQVKNLRGIIWPGWQKWKSGQVTMENYLIYIAKMRIRSRICEKLPDLNEKIENQVRWLRKIAWPARQKSDPDQSNYCIKKRIPIIYRLPPLLLRKFLTRIRFVLIQYADTGLVNKKEN